MLKQRVLTAIVLVALVLFSLLAEHLFYWQALVSLVIFVGFWEWLRFCKISSLAMQAFCFVMFTVLLLCFTNGLVPIPLMIVVTCVLWLLLIRFTLTAQLTFFHQQLAKVATGIWILNVAAYLLIQLKLLPNGPLWVLCFVATVAAADIGAYFIGRRFGKTKLAPTVSPGKTVEGLFGGLLLVFVIFVPILFSLFAWQQASLLLVTVLVTALVSVGGDLFESKLKRYVDLKDSSQILPGHGGVLDRIDGFLPAAPFFTLGLMALGFFN